MESSHRLHDESHGRHCRPLKVVHHTIWVWRGGGWLSVSLWFLVHRYVLVCTDKIPKTCNEDKKHKYLYIWWRKTLLTRTLYILNTKCLPVLDLAIFRFVTLFCEGEFWVTWYIFFVEGNTTTNWRPLLTTNIVPEAKYRITKSHD